MAYGPIQKISTDFEDYPNYWLKGYEQGTVTPLSMATDAAAGTLLAKAEISAGGVVPIGFIKTAGDVIFQPYFNADYDAWLFSTEAEADANDTSNAIQVADNVKPIEDASSTAYTLNATVADKLNNLDVDDYTALRAVDTTQLVDNDSIGVAYRVTEFDGGGGRFVWFTADLSTEVTADPQSGIYVAPNSDATGSSGAWVRLAFNTEPLNVKWFGAVGDGATDDATALLAAIDYWRAATTATLYFPHGFYNSTQPFNLANLGSAVKIIRGEKSQVDFSGLGNEPSLVDLLNSKEVRLQSLRFRYLGDFNDPPGNAPQVGILLARNSANEFSGRHQLIDVRVSGIYQLASLYNTGCEEIIYDDCEFRNNLTERRSCVVTCSNHLGATSANGSISTSAISTTLNTFIQPAFYSDGDTRENVCIRGAGGLTMINPYSSSGGFAHYAIQGIDQSCSAVKIIGYQCEVDRGSTGISADYAFRFEGDGTLDITSSDFSQQFTTVVINEMLIETLRDFKRNTINTGRGIVMSGTTSSIEGCNIRAGSGVNFSNATELASTDIYCEVRSTITLPTNSKSCQVTANDLDGPLNIGKVKQRSTASTVNLDEALMGFSGGGTINDFTSDFSGLPYIAQTQYGFCVSASMTISNSGGNIRTNTGADIVLTANEYVEIIYNGNADLYFVRLMGG